LEEGWRRVPERSARFGDRRAALERGPLPPSGPLTQDPLYVSFIDLMPLGNRAEDFAISLCALEASRPISDQADYDAFRSEHTTWSFAMAAFLNAHQAARRQRNGLSLRTASLILLNPNAGSGRALQLAAPIDAWARIHPAQPRLHVASGVDDAWRWRERRSLRFPQPCAARWG
jgi:hypothetical protein